MLDDWLFETIYKGIDWKEKEKQQIIDAQNYSQRGVTGEIYYEMTFKND